jgi:NAD(P)-dependent dehydrogenase (short-subunit alcohol dehydrogenase family)
MNPTPLAGTTAIVTGAGRGIGEACALALADAGADVALVARSADELTSVARRVEALGRSAWVLPCDITDPDQVDAAVGSLDRVDILVNNAGTDKPTAFLDVTPELLEELLAVNVKGTFYMSQAFARRVIAAESSGAIVNMSSQLGLVGGAYETAYCAAKFGVEGLTKSMAIELAKKGIRVNGVAPTVVETPRTAAALADPNLRQLIIGRIPLGRLALPEDVAAVVVHLASPAAAMVTGVTVPVDGGWVAQ